MSKYAKDHENFWLYSLGIIADRKAIRPAVAHEVVDDDCQFLVKQRQSYPRITWTRIATHAACRHPTHRS